MMMMMMLMMMMMDLMMMMMMMLMILLMMLMVTMPAAYLLFLLVFCNIDSTIWKYMQKCNNALHTTQRGNTAQPGNETESHKDDATELLDVICFPRVSLH